MFEPEQIATSEPASAPPPAAEAQQRGARPPIPEGSRLETEERAVPEAEEPRASEPEAPEPEAPEPEALEPEALEPEAPDPGTEDSDAGEPEFSSWRPAVAGLAVGLLLAVIVTSLVLRLNRVSDPGLHQRPGGAAASADAAEETAQSPGYSAE